MSTKEKRAMEEEGHRASKARLASLSGETSWCVVYKKAPATAHAWQCGV